MTPTRYVVGFVFHDDEVLLIEKNRPSWQRGRLNGVGGHVEPGETFLQAMVREFAEETGWHFQGWEHFATLCGDDRDSHRQGAHTGTDFEVAFFRGMAYSPGLPDVHPTDEPPRWARVNNLPDTVLPNLRWLIPLAWHAHRDDWPLLVKERSITLSTPIIVESAFSDTHSGGPPRRDQPPTGVGGD